MLPNSLQHLTLPSNNLPQCHTVLRVVEALNSTQEIRQWVLGVSANEGKKNPGCEEWRFGVPALLRKISPDRTAAGQEQEEQGVVEASEPGHRDSKLWNRIMIIYKWTVARRGLQRNISWLSGVITDRESLCYSPWCKSSARLISKGVGSVWMVKGVD